MSLFSGSKVIVVSRLSVVLAPKRFDIELKKNQVMGVHKVIEIMAFSTKSWEDAAQEAINGVAKNVRNIESIYIEDKSGKVIDNRIVQYRVNAKITFLVE